MSKLNGPYGMYGTVYGITTKVIHIAHPFPAKKVLQGVNKAQVTKSPAYNHFHNLFGDGVFTADGDDWKWQRKSVIHSLFSVSHNYNKNNKKGDTSNSISPQLRLENEANRAARQIMSEFTSFLIMTEEKAKEKAQRHNNEFMDYNISYHYEDEKKDDDHQETLTTTNTTNTKTAVEEDEINILPIIQKATNGIVSRFLTHDEDITSHHFNFKNNSTDNKINNDNYNTFLQKYLEAITEIRMVILAQSRSFWFLLPRIFYILFSKMYRQEQYLMRNYIGRYAQFIISKAKVNSPLHILIQQHENKKNNKNNKNSSSKLISKRVLDEAITLLFAGQDTSAATLSWTLHLLSLYPDCQEKLRQEILFFYDNDTQEKEKGKDSNTTTSSSSSSPQKKERHFSKKLTSKMPYLDAVLKESMRLYPVAPFVVRKLEEDIHIQPPQQQEEEATTKATTLPKDSLACIWIYGLHRNPKLWANPDEFDPDRWLVPPTTSSSTSTSSSTRKRDLGIEQGAFMPFAVGPRNCLGQSIGTLVLKILLSSIISQYQVLHKEMMKEVEELDKQKDEEEEEETNENDNKKRKKIKELQHSLRKDMQAGFTILPSGGVNVVLKKFASSN